MAASSNRAPSPLSSRPIIPPPHPSRTTENTNSTPRRSFNGNPFTRPSVLSTHRGFNPPTPANSPADSKRVSNSGIRGFEEKENELKAEKLRSPLKGSKHFMSPTISASSKIASSPKKKILVERNDPVRTSISLSDGKATFLSANFEVNSESSKIVKSMEETENLLDAKETVHVTKPPKKVTFLEEPSNCNNASESNYDTVVMDSEICNDKPPLVSPVIAPLDADPSLPPYDPITNYLSPRPQFRRYEPLPRFQADSFLSELPSDNILDIEGSESSQTEDSLKESDDSSSAEMSNEATDGSSSEERVHEAVVDQEDEVEPKITESVITPVVEEIAEAKMRTKESSSTKSLFFSLLLVLLIALVSFSVTDSPMLATPGSTGLRFSNSISSDIPVFAKASSYFKQFSGEAISYISKLINDPGRIDHFQQPLKFMNLTDLEEESSIEHGYLKGNIGSEELDEELEPVELEEDEEFDFEPDEEEVHMEADLDDCNEVELEEVNGSETEEGDLESEEASTIQLAEVNEADSLDNYLEQEQHDLETEEVSVVLAEGNESKSLEGDLDQGLTVSSVQLALELDDGKSSIPDNEVVAETEEVSEGNESESLEMDLDQGLTVSSVQLEPESVPDNEVVVESMSENAGSLVKDDSAVEDAQPLEILQSPVDRHGENVGAYQILGISSLVLGLLAAAAVLHSLKRNNKSLKPVVHADQVSSKKTETVHVTKEKHSSQNWPTEVDVAEQSCPTEMSSFQISSFYSKKYPNSVNDEAQSTEKKHRKINRRESLATSEYSVGTASYGSFTTYEKIPVKHAGGGEEVITTPVRRSSRIRSHVTSP